MYWNGRSIRVALTLAAASVLAPAGLEAQLVKATSTESIACGSSWNARRTCPVSGYIDRIDIVSDLSGRCRLNSTWGATRTEIWTANGCRADFRVSYRGTAAGEAEERETVTCGRNDGAQAECQISPNATAIRLVRNLGRSSCQQNRNWGYADGSIWTNRGCRGEFEVSYSGNASVSALPVTRVISCGSLSSGRVTCDARGTISDARLVNETSKSRCRPGLTWGYSGQALWTTSGCQGEFEVVYSR